MCQEISLPVPSSSFPFTGLHYSMQETWITKTMANEELFKSPTNSKNSGHKPVVAIDGGSRTETLFSPRFRSVAEMAGWDEEALLIASLIVEDTPERHSKQKKRPDLPNFKTPPSNSRRCLHATTFKKQIQILRFSVNFFRVFLLDYGCNIWVFCRKRRAQRRSPISSMPVVVLDLDEDVPAKEGGVFSSTIFGWTLLFVISVIEFHFSSMANRDREEFARTQNCWKEWTEENWQGWIWCSEIDWFLLEFLYSVYGQASWGALLRCKSFSIYSTYSSRSPYWHLKPLFNNSNIRTSLILTDMFGDLFRTQHHSLRA